MLFNVSYNEPKVNQAIEELVGKSFGLFENIKLNGTGSPRLLIHKASEEIQTLLDYDHNLNYCNIELRPKGIIIRFRSLLETYGLVIPYYKLVVFKPANYLSLHADHHLISVEFPAKNAGIHQFYEKMMAQKVKNTATNIDDL